LPKGIDSSEVTIYCLELSSTVSILAVDEFRGQNLPILQNISRLAAPRNGNGCASTPCSNREVGRKELFLRIAVRSIEILEGQPRQFA
jgi:hypothetical protein